MFSVGWYKGVPQASDGTPLYHRLHQHGEFLMTTATTPQQIPPALAALFDESVTRDRLMRAMSESLIEKGYTGTVVADIVKRARVSRRTFYEEFADRGDCLIAICARSTELARRVIDAAADPALPWEEQVEAAVNAYFDFLTADLRIAHAMLFEVYAVGERGFEAHREVSHAFAAQVVELAARSRAAGADIREVSYATAAAIVGAIYQLLQCMIEEPAHITIEQARRAAIDLVLDSARPRA